MRHAASLYDVERVQHEWILESSSRFLATSSTVNIEIHKHGINMTIQLLIRTYQILLPSNTAAVGVVRLRVPALLVSETGTDGWRVPDKMATCDMFIKLMMWLGLNLGV